MSMRIIVFAADESTREIFASLERKKDLTLDYMHHDDIRTWAKSGHAADVLYLDVRELPPKDLTRLVKRLVRSESGAVGILDTDNEVDDAGSLYFEGICDYLNAGVCDQGLRIQRVEAALRHHHRLNRPEVEIPAPTDLADKAGPEKRRTRNGHEIASDFPTTARAIPRLIPSPPDWSQIQSGQEYTFGLLYAGVDLDDTLRKDTRPELVRDSLEAFRGALAEAVEPFHGRVWFWKDRAGIVLFPFDGTNADAVTGTIHVYLRGMFWQAETRTNYLTERYRLALHVGNVVFEQGVKRETLVSDTINYLFHLGGMHAEPGQFVATEPVVSRCPDGFRHCFVPADSFKGLKIWRMRHILRPE